MKYLITLLIAFTLISCKEEVKKEPTKQVVKPTINVNKENKVSPLFVNYENYDGSKTSLVDLKGKYVYIDIWATWCPPCRAEIPFLQKLEKKYHNKNIEFVSISVDKIGAKNKWKEMIKDKKMGGIQLFAGKDNSFTTAYNVRGIPRFIFIDPKGNIVKSHAPRPSEQVEIETLFKNI